MNSTTEVDVIQLHLQGFSQRSIEKTLCKSRHTISRIINAFRESGIDGREALDLAPDELHQRLFPDEEPKPAKQVEPDFEHIYKELHKPGVTLKLLWHEYTDACVLASLPSYSYSQFCKHCQDYADEHHITMHIQHKPGDRVMVDWAGTPMWLHDEATGKASKAYLFVATLPFSMYCYAEACPNMKEAAWIEAHVHMYEFFGGSTRLLVSDNLKTGIIRHRRHEDPVANRAYKEMADHYGTALLPARVLSPQDKAAVEGSVGHLTTHIIAKLRNRKFFSLAEMNDAVRKELELINDTPFQKREDSRRCVFLEEEKPYLRPLPKLPYEYCEWRRATVQLNYHVAVDHHYYSVPYKYVRKRVDVKLGNRLIEIYFEGHRIASHKRYIGPRGQYTTVVEHMPPEHQLYSEWDGDRFRCWARKIGSATETVVDRQLSSRMAEEQAYKTCLSLLKLGSEYGEKRLEAACLIALREASLPGYQIVHRILATEQDKPKKASSTPEGAYLRGASYYGGERHD